MSSKKIILFPVILSSYIHLFGCATIVSGTTQNIAVSSNPTGATIVVEPGQYQNTFTPASMELERDGGPYRVTISHEGYEPYKVTLKTSTNGWLWGNLLLGGLIGIIVDSSTGAGTKLSPEEIKANLIKVRVDSESSHNNHKESFTADSTLLSQIRAD
ncbi:MAG: PEGA domain-containing protein [Gammaproteobacteria bacterium]|nr:PEGA domain-containing protein [Gammaproteobacteria bacterium]